MLHLLLISATVMVSPGATAKTPPHLCQYDLESEESTRPSELQSRAAAVVIRKPVTFTLPFAHSRELQLRLIETPSRLVYHPTVRIYLNYSDRVRSVIPTHRPIESWHSVARYFEDYGYTVGFDSPEERSQFLRIHPTGMLTEGEWTDAGGSTRHALMLTPAQFGAMLDLGLAKDHEINPDLFAASSRRILMDAGVVDSRTSGSGVTYYFDARRHLVGLRRRGRYYLAKDPSFVAQKNSASHFAILARQNPNLELSRFESRFGDTGDFGLSLAEREVEEIDAVLELLRRDPARADASARVEDFERRILDKGLADPWNIFALTKVMDARSEWLRDTLARGKGPIAGDVGADLTTICNSPDLKNSSLALRFVWIKAGVRARPIVLYSRRGMVLHHQMLGLLLGQRLRERFVTQDLVRGGLIEIHFDWRGEAERFEIREGVMRSRSEAGHVTKMMMTGIERQNLELALLNACREKPKNSKTQ